MTHKLVIILLAIVGSTWLLGVSRADAAPVTDPSKVLEVEVDPEMFQGEAHRVWVEERGHQLLERGHALSEGDRIVVHLSGMVYDYRVELRVEHRGRLLEDGPEPFTFEGTTEELLPLVDAAIEDAARRLAAEADAEAKAGAAADAEEKRRQEREQAEAETRATQEATLEQERGRNQRIRVVGATLTAVGGVGLATGVVLIALGPRDYEQESRLQSTTRPPGFIVLGVGGATLVVGVSILVWNRLRGTRSNGGSETARRVVPWVGATSAGASIMGRF